MGSPMARKREDPMPTQTDLPVKCTHPEDDQAWTSECCGAGYVEYTDLSEDHLEFCAKCHDGAAFVLVCDLCQEPVNG